MSTTQRRTAPRTTPPREWLTVDQAAAYYGVHPKTMRLWYRTGKIPAYLIGAGTIRIDRADLDAARQYVPGSVA